MGETGGMDSGAAPAACTKCGKTYRVSDRNKSFMCKRCGGAVRATAAPASRDGSDEPSTPLEVRRAKGTVRSGRMLYFVTGLVLGLRALELQRGNVHHPGMPTISLHHDPVGGDLVDLCRVVLGAGSGLAFVAILAASRRPLAWARMVVAVAAIATLVDLGLGHLNLLFAAMAVLSATRLARARGAQRTMRAHPELFMDAPRKGSKDVSGSAELLS